jgi:hypothetical protein
MRLEAAGSVLRLAFLGVTAASTLTSALALLGLAGLAPYVLAAGLGGTVAFSYAYVDRGVYGRKNRERSDYGENYAGPTMLIDDVCIGAAVFAATEGRPPDAEERRAIEEAVQAEWGERRDGVDV